MKILLTGASGLLGNAYALAAVRRGHEVIGISNAYKAAAPGLARSELINGIDHEGITSLCLEIWPDVIVNCAAISSSAQVDANPTLAEQINVALPRLLAQLATHLGARLIHISTDMVFNGRSKIAYRSTDMPQPTNLYGKTKLMAEREVLEHNPEDPVVLRIPILMGNSLKGSRSIHEKLIEAIKNNERPKLFCDEIRQPCSAENVADVCVELSERRDLHGIFHWAGIEKLSRFEIGQRILKHFNLPADAIDSAMLSDQKEYANRPQNLCFNLHPIVSKLKTKAVNFQDQLNSLTYRAPLGG